MLFSRYTQQAVFIRFRNPFIRVTKCARACRLSLRVFTFTSALCLLGLVAGCGRFHHEQYDTVYVSARQMYLHDRVAAVSERVAEVTNGEPLQVLERGRRFLKVKTGKNEVGWIEERAVIDSKTYEGFTQLAQEHKQDPVAASATLRDELYVHLTPGRDSEHFYLLPGNTKVDLLARAAAPRVSTPTATNRTVALAAPPPSKASSATPKPQSSKGASPVPATRSAKVSALAAPPEASPPPVMEDWWLARDGSGHVGWLLASRLDVEVPDAIGEYGEGQRFVGSWTLTKISDPDADTPDHQVPEYLSVLAPTSSGLPFDFDQVRVFTWSTHHHRYETAFRLHPIQGYLPVKVFTQATPKGNVPAFSFQIAGSDSVTTDPVTGITRPANPRTLTFQMIDTQVKRVGPDMGPIPLKRDKQAEKKAKTEKSAKKKHK